MALGIALIIFSTASFASPTQNQGVNVPLRCNIFSAGQDSLDYSSLSITINQAIELCFSSDCMPSTVAKNINSNGTGYG